LSYAAL
jgi:hypothetical protein